MGEFERLKSEDSYVLRHIVLKLTIAKMLYLLEVLEQQKLQFKYWKKYAPPQENSPPRNSPQRRVKWQQQQRQKKPRKQRQGQLQQRQPSQREIATLQKTKLKLEQERRFRRFQRERKKGNDEEVADVKIQTNWTQRNEVKNDVKN